MTKRQTMPFRDACDLVSDDMPDGAFWALAHEIAGLEYGDGFDELIEEDTNRPIVRTAAYPCRQCKKSFKTRGARRQHIRDRHP